MERKQFYELDEIQDEYGMWIVVDDHEKPFTGVVIETFEDGTLSYEGEHINGRICGFEKRWHENGQLSSYDQKYNNSSHGTSQAWYEDGQIKLDATFKFGNAIHYKRYNPDGSVKEEFNIENDKEKLASFNILVERIKEKGLEEQWDSIFTTSNEK